MQKSSFIISLLVLLLSVYLVIAPCSAHSQEDYIPIGDGTRFACTSEGKVARKRGDDYRVLGRAQVREVKRSLRTAIRRLKRRLKRLTKQGRDTSSVETQLLIKQETLTDIQDCLLGELIDACRVAGNTTAADQAKRIIGGDTCERGDSFVVEIDAFYEGIPIGSCTGFLVAPTIVVSAAHCFYYTWDYGGYQLTDIATSAKIKTGSDESSIDSERIDVLEYLDVDTDIVKRENDVAVVRLKNASLARTVEILLPGQAGGVVGDKAVVAGFGLDSEGFSGVLNAGTTTLAADNGTFLQTTYLGNAGESNTCKGDSGGPLLMKINDVWTAVGILSAGTDPQCGVGDTVTYVRTNSAEAQGLFQDYLYPFLN